jgi:hypothetical protein
MLAYAAFLCFSFVNVETCEEERLALPMSAIQIFRQSGTNTPMEFYFLSP